MSTTTVNHSMIGQILQSFGRITEADVEAALQYQRQHGGYFGEALLALGLVTREELDWGLASQFDIPYVFPDAASIDPEATALVTPEWALANLTLPILKTADTLNVVVDTPIWSDAVDELQSRTDLKVELGLASSARIRALIGEVYGEPDHDSLPEPEDPLPAEEMLSTAFGEGAARCGLSVRGDRATGWMEVDGTTTRIPLEPEWQQALERVLTPPPSTVDADQTKARWDAELRLGTTSFPIEVSLLQTPTGSEFVFESMKGTKASARTIDQPNSSVLSEMRLLVSSGSGRFVVTAHPPELADLVVHSLPSMVLEDRARFVAVTDGEVTPLDDETFVQTIDHEDGPISESLDELRSFRFDAASIALGGEPAEWLGSAVKLARTVFVRWADDADPSPLREAKVRWEVRIEEREGHRMEWILRSFRADR